MNNCFAVGWRVHPASIKFDRTLATGATWNITTGLNSSIPRLIAECGYGSTVWRKKNVYNFYNSAAVIWKIERVREEKKKQRKPYRFNGIWSANRNFATITVNRDWACNDANDMNAHNVVVAKANYASLWNVKQINETIKIIYLFRHATTAANKNAKLKSKGLSSSGGVHSQRRVKWIEPHNECGMYGVSISQTTCVQSPMGTVRTAIGAAKPNGSTHSRMWATYHCV